MKNQPAAERVFHLACKIFIATVHVFFESAMVTMATIFPFKAKKATAIKVLQAKAHHCGFFLNDEQPR